MFRPYFVLSVSVTSDIFIVVQNVQLTISRNESFKIVDRYILTQSMMLKSVGVLSVATKGILIAHITLS